MTSPPPLLLRVTEAADLLRLSPSTVRRLIAAGTLPAVQIPSPVGRGARAVRRIRLADLQTFAASLPSTAPDDWAELLR